MQVEKVVMMGVVVAGLWLHVVYYDEIQRLSGRWARWWPTTERAVRLRPVMRVLVTGMAVVASVVYGVMVVAYVVG